MEENEDQEYEKYVEERNLLLRLNEILMKLFCINVRTEDEYRFAKHLSDYVYQTIKSCVEIGVQRGMLPISKIDVWYGMLGDQKKEFMYRRSVIGGEPYQELNLARISELLQKAVNDWAEESFDMNSKFIEDDRPVWIIDEEE